MVTQSLLPSADRAPRLRTLLPRLARRAIALSVALPVCVAASLAATPDAHALDDAALKSVVERRLLGDRTGACFATAVIDGAQVARAYVCADGKDPASRIDADTAFEIGSVSKPVMAVLLAGLIREGKASLDDPLSKFLPADAKVPDFEGKPILLRHIVTHTSGLPSIPASLHLADAANPYAKLTGPALVDALAKTSLARAPGAQFEYSNFAAMLLSYGLSRSAGVDVETQLRERVFLPLGMRHTYVTQRPEGVKAAVGHLPNAAATSPWDFAPELAGVGGVRATLDDMVRFVQGQFGDAPKPLDADFARTHVAVSNDAGAPMAMHWMLANLNGQIYRAHEGGTGGFSSFVAFDPASRRGVVILSDTALHSFGGLGSLGLHLLDPKAPLGKPRKAGKPSSELLDALVGTYRLEGGLGMRVRRVGDSLQIEPDGQSTFLMGYDDTGDFHPLVFDALLTPQRRADGRMRFVWTQSGGQQLAERTDVAAVAVPSAQTLTDYPGEYPLAPGFALQVRVEGDRLLAQATGQGAFPLTGVAKDVFEFAQAGIVIRFRRDQAGKVVALALEQGGQTLQGERR